MKTAGIAITGFMCFILSVVPGHGDMHRQRIELLMRELMPAPVRCEASPQESLFFCRHQTESAQSVALGCPE